MKQYKLSLELLQAIVNILQELPAKTSLLVLNEITRLVDVQNKELEKKLMPEKK